MQNVSLIILYLAYLPLFLARIVLYLYSRPTEPYVLVTATSFISTGFEDVLLTFYKRF